ncbi:MAG: hypothetical protein AAF221_03455 [Pseudomonadota bacterium]
MTARAAIHECLTGPVPPAAAQLAQTLLERFPGSDILLYGSGMSVLASADPADVLYDFYVVVPDYKRPFPGALMRLAAAILPPNVFYHEQTGALGLLRCKYAVLSMAHFEKLVSMRTFHSYFWARFAQPSRRAAGSGDLERLAQLMESAINTFTQRAAPLAAQGASVTDIWKAGLSASYKAELRAESPERVDKLLASYGAWPAAVTLPQRFTETGRGGQLAWRVRAWQGVFLSAARLIKGVFTFEGGIDYIAWKISRHAGFDLPVKPWERRWPLLGVPFVAQRYYRLKAQKRQNA